LPDTENGRPDRGGRIHMIGDIFEFIDQFDRAG
jgi:hypothetical protein